MAKDVVARAFRRNTKTGPWSSNPGEVFPPVNTSAPVVSGTARVGSTLSCSTGSWDNEPTSYAYQWLRDGDPISGATSSTYVLIEADEGEMISCVVTATNAAGSAPQASNSVGPVEEASEETFDYYIGPSGSDSNDGLTPETPWAITALNTKRATYAGKRVGLLGGTYSTTGLGSGSAPALDIGGGSEGSPTVIQAVNPRQAIIEGDGSSTRAAIGSFRSDTYHITLKSVVVRGCTASTVRFHNSSGQGGGIRIEGCDLGEQSFNQADVTCALWLQSLDDAVVHNCYFHDVANTAQAVSAAGLVMYGCRRTEITECTFDDITSGIYDKYAGGSPGSRIDMQETRVRRCYFYACSNALYGFDNKDQTGTPPNDPPYGPYIIENNVFENCGAILTNPGSFSAAAPVYFRNNTMYKATSGAADGPSLHALNSSCRPSFYNNVWYHISPATWGGYRSVVLAVSGGVALADVVNYNCYGPGGLQWCTHSGYGYPYTGSYSAITSESSWKSATGAEGNSLFSVNASFVGTGVGADKFQLGGSSPCLNAGRRGGTSGGDVCHIGAWDGAVTQIGCDF